MDTKHRQRAEFRGAGAARPLVEHAVQRVTQDDCNRRVAYIVSRFPKLTETFVLYEMIAVEQCGVNVQLYPLQREREAVTHPEAKTYVERAHYQPLLSWPILKANLGWLVRKPGGYLSSLLGVLKGTWGNRRMFAGSLALFPKAAYFAESMQREGINHIHAHFARHPATAAWVIHRLTGIPYSFTAHGSDIHVDRRMLREKVEEADFVVPISEYNRKVILEATQGKHSGKLRVIHCGVDTRDAFQVRSWPQDEQEHRPASIVCIGTLHEVKGQIYLIESCKRLKEAGFTFSCHFIGDGPDRLMLEQAVEQAGLNEMVVFHGQMSRPAVLAMLQETDILVTPSVPTRDGRREGIPTVLMEAMASGVPVVASDLSGIPELVQHELSGLLVAPRDVKGLTKAIEQLIRRPDLRRRYGEAGRGKVEREFDLQRNAARLAAQFVGERV